MKNFLNIKGFYLTSKNISQPSAVKTRGHQTRNQLLKKRWRLALSLLLIGALASVSLTAFDPVVPKAQAQGPLCSSEVLPDRIFQRCPLNGEVERALEEQAISDVLALHRLPPSERSRLLSDGRNQLRAAIFLRLLELINKPSLTASEQQALTTFAERIRQKRVAASTKAIERYNTWKANPCAFIPTTGFAGTDALVYDPGMTCSGNQIGILFFGSPLSPTVEEFQQFGGYEANRDLATPEAQEAASVTASQIVSYTSVGAAGLGGAVGVYIGTLLPNSFFAAIFPFSHAVSTTAVAATTGAANATGTQAVTQATQAAASATRASGSIRVPVAGTTLAGGVVAIAVTAITVAVTRGIDVVNASQVEGKLQAALAEAQKPVDLRQLINTEKGIQEFYGDFILTTLPEPDNVTTVPPPASANDHKFFVTTHVPAPATTIESPTFTYRNWKDNCHTVRLKGGWFVDTDQFGVERLTLSIKFKNWSHDKVVASRAGSKFLLSDGEAFDGARGPGAGQEVSELRFLGCTPNDFKSARIKFEELTVDAIQEVPVRCLTFFPEQGTGVILGSLTGTGDSPAALTVTVNGQASATMNGITVRYLGVNDQYQIVANVVALDPPPLTADFTVEVTNSLDQTSSAPFSIRKTAIIDSFAPVIATNADVGAPYYSPLRTVATIGPCLVNSTFAITGGELPPGLSLVVDTSTLIPIPQIQGTPTAAGFYTFTVTETLTNGEQQSGTFNIFVKHPVAAMPDGVVSWWRGDGNAEDYFNHHNGSLVGNGRFDTGFTNEAFRFNGTNGYVALPGDTFDPSHDYSFELWFKTATPGAILGYQRSSIPYQTPLQGTRAPLYVGTDGKLQARMFGSDSDPFVASPARVDDNTFHHAAVVYSRTSGVETVYLDGQSIGTLSAVSSTVDPGAVYQLGTGYVSDAQLNMSGWFNFNGLLDEVTLYDRQLTAAEITAITRAGGGGKIYINPVAVPPSMHNGTNGAITVLARGGAGALRYSKDNGNTFQDSNTFYDLSPGTYQIVVTDIFERAITRAVTVPNPPAGVSLASVSRNPNCALSPTGRITLVAVGVAGQVEYSISNGATRQSSNVFENLAAGTYTPWVRETSTGTVSIGQPIVLTDPPVLDISPATVPAAVVGQAYSKTFTSSGGTGERRMTATNLPPWLTVTNTASGLTISGTPQQVGSSTITVKVVDANGCVREITVSLAIVVPCATPPVISACPATQTASANANCQAAVPDFSPAIVASDGCTPGGPLTITQSPMPGMMVGLGTTSVTLTVTDANNNHSTCTTSVTVIDAAPPALNNCPANITTNTTAKQCAATVTYTPPTASDNCSAVGTPSCIPPSGSSFPKGTTTITCSVKDAANNPSSCSFTVTVNDNQSPTVTAPANITKNTDPNSCSATVTYTLPAASDNCPLPPNAVVCSPPSGATFNKGTTTVTCTATDAAGLTGTSTFTVTINDNQAPAIACPANIIKGTDPNQCSATVSYTSPTATDNCSGVSTVTCTPSSGTVFPKGTTTVICTARDTANNQANCSFTITVNDNQPPAIACPANISAPAAAGQCSMTVTYATPAVSDNCSGVAAPACLPPSGSTFAKGITTVICSVRDAVGNQSACSFTITVLDTQAPQIACPSGVIAGTNNAGETSVAVIFPAPTAADNCPGVAVVCSPPSGSAFPRGVTTVTCTATDTSNNQISCSFTVRVFDYVIVDDTNGKLLRFDSVTGDYDFFDCRKNKSLSGRGTVTINSCKTELRDTGPDAQHPDRNLLAQANPCTRKGSATLVYQSLTHTLNDSDLSHNLVRCP